MVFPERSGHVPTEVGAIVRPRARSLLTLIFTMGPGILVMLADTDAGNVVTAAQSGAKWGYRLLPLLLGLIPVLYMVQELAVRLGIFTGRDFSELVRYRFGKRWAWFSVAGLALGVAGSMVTEFAAVAGIGELYGVSRNLTLPLAASALLIIVLSGSYRRVERTAILIGSFEIAFIVVAARSHPGVATIARDIIDVPIGNANFWLMAAALIGAVFNPWMVFYQQSATAEKQLDHAHYRAARADTALGAVLTQTASASVLFIAAATFGAGGAPVSLESVGQISEALTPHLGATAGRLIFSLGVLGASIVAAIVCSLALAWALGEAVGHRRRALGSSQTPLFRTRWFFGVYTACVLGGAALVWGVPNLIWLTIWAQIVNAFLLPMVVGFLVILAASSLAAPNRLRGWYLKLVVIAVTATCAGGIFGAIYGCL
jgi:NRAMP (natural resistance-associated macrophage protein)-like metal ion transporter